MEALGVALHVRKKQKKQKDNLSVGTWVRFSQEENFCLWRGSLPGFVFLDNYFVEDHRSVSKMCFSSFWFKTNFQFCGPKKSQLHKNPVMAKFVH